MNKANIEFHAEDNKDMCFSCFNYFIAIGGNEDIIFPAQWRGDSENTLKTQPYSATVFDFVRTETMEFWRGNLNDDSSLNDISDVTCEFTRARAEIR